MTTADLAALGLSPEAEAALARTLTELAALARHPAAAAARAAQPQPE